MPVSDAQLKYFMAMLDADGDGSVSYREFVTSIKDCYSIHHGVLAKDRVDIVDVLSKVSAYLKREKVQVGSFLKGWGEG
eukprot:327023-Chlamydomonas_euryale.AAC.2